VTSTRSCRRRPYPNVEESGGAVGCRVRQKWVTGERTVQTTNPRILRRAIFARAQIYHAADAMAQIVIQKPYFHIPWLGLCQRESLIMPWCTLHGAGELAHVGMYEQDRRRKASRSNLHLPARTRIARILDGEDEGSPALCISRRALDEGILGADDRRPPTPGGRHMIGEIFKWRACRRLERRDDRSARSIPIRRQAEVNKKAVTSGARRTLPRRTKNMR